MADGMRSPRLKSQNSAGSISIQVACTSSFGASVHVRGVFTRRTSGRLVICSVIAP